MRGAAGRIAAQFSVSVKKSARLCLCDSEIRRFGDSAIRRFGDSEIRPFGLSEIRRFCNSEIRRFGDSEIRPFISELGISLFALFALMVHFFREPSSAFRRFGDSEIRRFGNSEIQPFGHSAIQPFGHSAISALNRPKGLRWHVELPWDCGSRRGPHCLDGKGQRHTRLEALPAENGP